MCTTVEILCNEPFDSTKVRKFLFTYENEERLCYMHLLRQMSNEFSAFILCWEDELTDGTRQR